MDHPRSNAKQARSAPDHSPTFSRRLIPPRSVTYLGQKILNPVGLVSNFWCKLPEEGLDHSNDANRIRPPDANLRGFPEVVHLRFRRKPAATRGRFKNTMRNNVADLSPHWFPLKHPQISLRKSEIQRASTTKKSYPASRRGFGPLYSQLYERQSFMTVLVYWRLVTAAKCNDEPLKRLPVHDQSFQ